MQAGDTYFNIFIYMLCRLLFIILDKRLRNSHTGTEIKYFFASNFSDDASNQKFPVLHSMANGLGVMAS